MQKSGFIALAALLLLVVSSSNLILGKTSETGTEPIYRAFADVCTLCCVPGTYSCEVSCDEGDVYLSGVYIYSCSYTGDYLSVRHAMGSMSSTCTNGQCVSIVTTSTTTTTTTQATTSSTTTTTTTSSTSSTTSSSTTTSTTIYILNSARYVSQSVDSTMCAGTNYVVSITMTNNGSSTWTMASGHKLGSQNPEDNLNWGLNRVLLGASDSITPGASKIFSFNVVAPLNTGDYDFQWRMLQENVEWFGDYTPNTVVTVILCSTTTTTTTSTSTSSTTSTTTPICRDCCAVGTSSCHVLCDGGVIVNNTGTVYFCSYDGQTLDFSDDSGSITMQCQNAVCGTVVTTTTTTTQSTTSTTSGSTTTTVSTTSTTTTTKPLPMCWGPDNERLPKSSIHMRKFCRCVTGIYDYSDYSYLASTYESAHKYADTSNNNVWTTIYVASTLEPIVMVKCADDNWYSTANTYYYGDTPVPDTTTTTTTSTTTTTTQPCILVGDYPECGTVTLQEVLDLINLWTTDEATLGDVLILINAWETT